MVFESDMNKSVLNYFQDYHSLSEVPMDNRRIDWVFYDKQLTEIIAVELKLKDWKKALKQALYNTFCSHKSYVAIWYKYSINIQLDWFKQSGVGVLRVDENKTEEILKPIEIEKHVITESMKKIITQINNSEITNPLLTKG